MWVVIISSSSNICEIVGEGKWVIGSEVLFIVL